MGRCDGAVRTDHGFRQRRPVEAEVVSLLVQFPEMVNNDRRVAYNIPQIFGV